MLPQIAPLPSTQIVLTGLGPLAVQQFLRPAKVVLREGLLREVHVRCVGPLPSNELLSLGFVAQLRFIGSRGIRGGALIVCRLARAMFANERNGRRAEAN